MSLAAAVGGAAGAMALVGIVIIFVWYCLLRRRSVTNSSEPSLQGQSIEMSFGGGVSYPPGLQEARRFTLEELNVATKNFGNINLIGYGMFGEVYKGLLHDGMIVAIKIRPSAPRQEFVEEVHYLSSIRHRNLVSLLGYCQENDLQMLIYEYIPNGSVSTHLYGSGQVATSRLEFKHRLSIAHGAAKDEDFIPKVADAGLRSLLDRIDDAGPSSRMTTDDPFLDPEVKESGRFSVTSDVYSFGVFLMELVSGREARSDLHIIELAQSYQEPSNISTLVDQRMGSSFTSEGMSEFLRLIAWCLNPSSERRPPMNFVESELDRIREKEMSLTTIMPEGSTTVTLGSQLFTTM
ncbi:probable serine/threonine-protein kinase PBL22 isoform X3 [Elaeis guineensis]|uniref:non-specific serine/threonine protein kinase n=1 Tax=Elaeis guineensis var. tenera TaxID=51953 RepID=A0A6I9QGZ9_ELAGV|nr:probable serine/threonine-protein kinase PBL22 isoform X2 [Elaeis guineensis]